MSVTTPILFGIGVVGGDKAKAQLGMVAAGAVVAAAAMVKLWKAADEYGDALANVTTDMSKYNLETKGLIDTTTGLQQANKLQIAGLKATAEQMASLGKAAIVMSRATGVDATEAFKQLTDGISKGSTRAIRQFGIDVSESGTQVQKMTEMVEGINQKFKHMKIEIEDIGELFSALGNNIGTFTSQSVINIGKLAGSLPGLGGALNGINDHLTKATSLWEETGGKMWEMDNLLNQLQISINLASGAWSGNSEAVKQAALDYGNLHRVMAGYEQSKKDAAAASPTSGDNRPEVLTQYDPYTGAEIQPLVTWVPNTGTDDETLPSLPAHQASQKYLDYDMTAESTGGKGGGGPRPAPTYELSGSERSQLFGAMLAPNLGMDMEADRELAQTQQTEWEKIVEEDRRNRLAENHDYTWNLELEAAEAEKQLQAEKHEWMLANSEEYAAAQRAITLDTAMEYTEGVGQIFANLGSLMETKSKKAFAVGKAAAIASAVISTALAAVQAFTSFTSLPIVGVPLGIAAAAAAVAAGAVQIAKIKATTFEGGSSSSTSSFTASMPSASGGSYPADTSAGGSGDGTPIQINIKIGDESFGDVMTRINDKRSQRGQQAFKVA